MYFSYSIPNGFGDHLNLLIAAPSRAEADLLAAQAVETAHGKSWAHIANPSFDLRDARVTERSGPVLEASLESHETGNYSILD